MANQEKKLLKELITKTKEKIISWEDVNLTTAPDPEGYKAEYKGYELFLREAVLPSQIAVLYVTDQKTRKQFKLNGNFFPLVSKLGGAIRVTKYIIEEERTKKNRKALIDNFFLQTS